MSEQIGWKEQLTWLGYGLLLIFVGSEVGDLVKETRGWLRQTVALCGPAFMIGLVMYALFKAAKEQSYQTGHEEGHAVGYSDGFDAGYEEGLEDGRFAAEQDDDSSTQYSN